ncbi:MAG: heme biosynthesis HemY N-terminal domain-containing protein [Legionellales bacterium]
MMRILLAFVVLLGAVFLGLQLNYDSGYVLIAINHWTIETTLWVMVFTLILLFLIMHVALHLFNKITHIPGALNKWHSKKLIQKAQETTHKGLIEYSEGYWLNAKNHLIQAVPNTDTPLLNYLTAARAAQKMGDGKLRDQYLREAQQSMPEAKIAVELTQAQLQLANCQWEQALATLRHLQDLAPRHPYVLKLLMHLYEEVRDWTQLIALLPSLRKNKVINKNEFEQLEKNTYLKALADLAKQNQAEAITALFHALPKSLAKNPELVAEYVRFLYCNPDCNADAEVLLRHCLRKEFNTQLIELYGLLLSDEHQLTFAESLLKKNPHSAALHLCLGRLCLTRHLWGKAKKHLEQANEIEPSPVIYVALGKLHERLNDQPLACMHYKKGLELATKNMR